MAHNTSDPNANGPSVNTKTAGYEGVSGAERPKAGCAIHWNPPTYLWYCLPEGSGLFT